MLVSLSYACMEVFASWLMVGRVPLPRGGVALGGQIHGRVLERVIVPLRTWYVTGRCLQRGQLSLVHAAVPVSIVAPMDGTGDDRLGTPNHGLGLFGDRGDRRASSGGELDIWSGKLNCLGRG